MSDNRHQAALSKTLTLLALGTFVALASLTASLPLNLPRNQVYKSAAYLDPLYPDLNNGDTAWMIVATIFGLFLGPALGYLYALLNGHDAAHAIKTVLLAESLITTLWIVFSFSLIYGEDANGDQILGFPLTYYMFRDVGPAPDATLAPTIPLSIFAIFELGFAIVTATLVAVSVLGRVNLTGFLFFIFAWHLTIYAPTAHIVWHPKGWFRNYHIEDFAGGIVVNMLASVTIIVLHLILGREGTPKTKPTSHASLALSALLTVWFLWFGFNSGKAHNAGSVATQSIVNTIGGTTSAVLTWYFLDLLFERTTTSVTLVNAVLLGLVATTPSSGYLTVGGSMALAIWTVLIVFFVSVIGLGEAKEVNEPLSIVSIHGIGGTISFVFTAFISYQFINPDAENGLTYGRGIPLAYQIAAALVVWFCCFIAVGLLAFLSNLIVPLGLPSDAPAPQSAEASNGAEKSADAVEPSKAELAEA